MREDPNAVYDRRRCRVCGRPWRETTGPDGEVIEGPHPDHVPIEGRSEPLTCAIHRPTGIAPGWVGEALARHELAATASTREWPLRERPAAVDQMAGWPASAVNGVHVDRSGYAWMVSTAAVKNGAEHA